MVVSVGQASNRNDQGGGASPIRLLHTNVEIYFAIAEEAAREVERLDKLHRKPKPNCEEGFVITYDPDQRSFKQAMIAIAFSGMYLEALLGIEGPRRLGVEAYRKVERRHYEDRLRAMGVTSEQVIADCKRFRNARNDLMHEKSDLTDPKRSAQGEAAHAIQFVLAVRKALTGN